MVLIICCWKYRYFFEIVTKVTLWHTYFSPYSNTRQSIQKWKRISIFYSLRFCFYMIILLKYISIEVFFSRLKVFNCFYYIKQDRWLTFGNGQKKNWQSGSRWTHWFSTLGHSPYDFIYWLFSHIYSQYHY